MHDVTIVTCNEISSCGVVRIAGQLGSEEDASGVRGYPWVCPMRSPQGDPATRAQSSIRVVKKPLATYRSHTKSAYFAEKYRPTE